MVSQFQGTNSFNLSLSVISKNGKLEGLGVLLSSRSEKGGGDLQLAWSQVNRAIICESSGSHRVDSEVYLSQWQGAPL